MICWSYAFFCLGFMAWMVGALRHSKPYCIVGLLFTIIALLTE